MSVEPWSLDRALTQLAEGDCPELLTQNDLNDLRAVTAAKRGNDVGYSDALLLHVINNELVSSIVTATYIDEHDERHLEEQRRFAEAYESFNATIKSLAEPLRSSVALPDSYQEELTRNFLLTYAKPKPVGRPEEFRRDEFYMSLLVLFQMITGQRPGGGEAGPTVRFFRAIVQHLGRCLEVTTDGNGETRRAVGGLWWLPVNRTFLKDWMGNKGWSKSDEMRNHIDQMVTLHIAAYSRIHSVMAEDPMTGASIIPFPGAKPNHN